MERLREEREAKRRGSGVGEEGEGRWEREKARGSGGEWGVAWRGEGGEWGGEWRGEEEREEEGRGRFEKEREEEEGEEGEKEEGEEGGEEEMVKEREREARGMSVGVARDFLFERKDFRFDSRARNEEDGVYMISINH